MAVSVLAYQPRQMTEQSLLVLVGLGPVAARAHASIFFLLLLGISEQSLCFSASISEMINLTSKSQHETRGKWSASIGALLFFWIMSVWNSLVEDLTFLNAKLDYNGVNLVTPRLSGRPEQCCETHNIPHGRMNIPAREGSDASLP